MDDQSGSAPRKSMSAPLRLVVVIAAALLDQRVMTGVGNVYCNELCFVFGYLPTA